MLDSVVKNSLSLTYYFLVAIHAVDHCGVLEPSGSAVDDQIHVIAQTLVNKLGVSEIAYVIGLVVGNGGGEQGSMSSDSS